MKWSKTQTSHLLNLLFCRLNKSWIIIGLLYVYHFDVYFLLEKKNHLNIYYIFLNNNPLSRDYLNLRSIHLKLLAALYPQTSGKRKYLQVLYKNEESKDSKT